MSYELINTIFLPTDLTEAGESAFYHALRLSLCFKAGFRVLHISGSGKHRSWDDFPRVRQTLVKWGFLEPLAPKQAVGLLGINVRKSLAESEDPVKAIVSYLEKHPADLAIWAPRALSGFQRLARKSISQAVAQEKLALSLFIPPNCKGFVDAETGNIHLKKILIPVDHEPSPKACFEVLKYVLESLDTQDFMGRLLFVHNSPGSFPCHRPKDLGGSWDKITLPGNPVEVITQQAVRFQADLIVMVTKGRKGLLDALRGSTTERVVAESPCPVLAIPLISD